MTTAHKIMAFIAEHPGRHTTAEFVQATEAKTTTVAWATARLGDQGKLVRVRKGVFDPAPDAAPEAEATSEPATPAKIGWALWDDGEMVFTVDGEHALHLPAADVERLAVWLQSRVA